MELIRVTLEDLKAGRPLFSNPITENPNVYFHGTSSISEQNIDQHGFQPQAKIVPKSIINLLYDLMEALHWHGTRNDGLPALRAYAVKDLLDTGERPVFFSCSSIMAAKYATEYRAGGEAACAVRLISKDIIRLCEDDAFFREYLSEIYNSFASSAKHFLPREYSKRRSDVEYRDIDDAFALANRMGFPHQRALIKLTAELKTRVSALMKNISDDYEELKAIHRYGIVYAVDLDQIHRILDGGNNNFAVCSVPPDRIVAKSIIPLKCNHLLRHHRYFPLHNNYVFAGYSQRDLMPRR